MKLSELLGIVEMSQDVEIFKVGGEGSCYKGMAAHVPDDLKRLDVELVDAYDWELDILVG